MNQHLRIRDTLITALLAPLLVAGALQGAEIPAAPATVQAVWKPVDLQFSYHGLTTNYSCQGLEWRMEAILQVLGAHPNTNVLATGCPSNGPSDHAFVHIKGAFPAPATQENVPTSQDNSRAELLKRLGIKPGVDQDQFAANEKVIDLSRERKAGLEPGDCELLERLSREVLPKLGLKVVDSSSSCFPGQIPISTPRLKVSALIKVSPADEAKPAASGKPD